MQTCPLAPGDIHEQLGRKVRHSLPFTRDRSQPNTAVCRYLGTLERCVRVVILEGDRDEEGAIDANLNLARDASILLAI